MVSPVYLAEDCILELCRRLRLVLPAITNDYEIILVDDRSPDNSWMLIQEEARKDSRVKGIRLSRNFGQHRAITAGLDIAKGDWVVVMDCDLQDSPEEIPQLYFKALEGFEIVIAQFEERAESILRQCASRFFWNRLTWLSGIPFDYRIGNFRIMSHRVVKNFRQYREQVRLLGGITSLMGFTSTTLTIKRNMRFAGKTSYTFQKLFSNAIDLTMAYSDKPLRIFVVVGLVISILSFIAGIFILILGIVGIIEVPGWASVMVSLYLIGGLVIATLGVNGYYIGRIFEETKRRPLYLVENNTYEPSTTEISIGDQLINNGRVLWITGLSGAGKTTLALEVVARLRVAGKAVVMLDGDELREAFGVDSNDSSNHQRVKRLALAFQYARLCQVIAGQGLTVVIATISLFHEVHTWNRLNLPGYFEVYLRVGIDELRRRDPKGIYKRFDAGELTHVAGLDMSIDEPEAADWIIDFNKNKSVTELADELINRLESK